MQEPESRGSALKLLRMRDLTAEYGFTPATVYRWISEGAFPPPINLGSNSVAWHRQEIEDWLQSRPRAKVRMRDTGKTAHAGFANATSPSSAEEGARS